MNSTRNFVLDLSRDPARLRDYAATLALLVGGAWTLVHYYKIHEQEEATLRIQRIKSEQGREGLQLTIEGHQAGSPDQSAKFLVITVTAENKGNNPIALHFADQPPLTLARLIFQPGEAIASGFGEEIHPRIMGGPHPADTILDDLIQPSEIVRYTAVAAAPERGLYLVLFDTHVGQDAEWHQDSNVDRSRHWLVSNYVFVQ